MAENESELARALRELFHVARSDPGGLPPGWSYAHVNPALPVVRDEWADLDDVLTAISKEKHG